MEAVTTIARPLLPTLLRMNSATATAARRSSRIRTAVVKNSLTTISAAAPAREALGRKDGSIGPVKQHCGPSIKNEDDRGASRSVLASNAASSVKASPRKRRRVAGDHDQGSAKLRIKNEGDPSLPDDLDATSTPAVKAEDAEPDKPRRRKKVKDEEQALEVFPPRVPNSSHHVGAHISSAGGVENAILNALRIGGNAFSLFVRPKMQWASKPLTEANTSQFQLRAKQHGYSGNQVVPHGCYLVNLANPDEEKREKSFEAFLDDLTRCEQLGLERFNFHPGSTVGQCTKEEGCGYIAEAINRAHGLTRNVCILIENMAGAGNLVGGRFEELRDIIAMVDDKSRVGICLDTCHAFAAGYDVRTPETYHETMLHLADTVGFEYVKAVHLNDSKTPLGSHRDRHENIGAGFLGLFPFYAIMNDPRFAGMPLILETPGGEDHEMHEVWKREVAALYSLQGLPADPATWTTAHTLLAEVQALRAHSKAVEETKKARLKAKRGKVED